MRSNTYIHFGVPKCEVKVIVNDKLHVDCYSFKETLYNCSLFQQKIFLFDI